MPLLEAINVSKIYRADSQEVAALRDVSFRLEAGDFVSLLGKSGGGKSTLLNLCGAVDLPTSGEIRIDGRPTSGLSDSELTHLRRERVGFIFQSFQLLHTLSAIENVELPLLLARKSDARAKARERLRRVGLEDAAARFPHQLSGGQQQRVAIARALVHDPKLLMADEPTGNLDTITGRAVLELLRQTASEMGIGILMATHSQESAAYVSRTFRMQDGFIEEETLSAGSGR